jgi:hypothetical protein
MERFALFSSSEGFFNCREPLAQPKVAAFGSMQGRILALGCFFKTLFSIPIAFAYKAYKTVLSFLGVGFGLTALILTLCSSLSVREFFVKKFTQLAKELADWILWPIAAFLCLVRLLLAASVHPALYFHT